MGLFFPSILSGVSINDFPFHRSPFSQWAAAYKDKSPLFFFSLLGASEIISPPFFFYIFFN